jgi:branched-chain amino acid aminotransferase
MAGAPFGTVLVEQMSLARWSHGAWDAPKLGPLEPFVHPAAHVLHYGSSCFEGLKAHRGADGVVRIFRLDRHAQRLQESAAVLLLPPPPTDLVREMVIDVVRASLPEVPVAPGSLYLRPTLIGTEQNIGAAAHPSAEAALFVLASPVGDYFAGGDRALALAVETARPRTTAAFGRVKTGANYAMALGPTRAAAAALGIDQLLFAPGGLVEETGASNVFLLDGERLITPALTDSFLHGVTRDSILTIAADLGYVVEERAVTVDELLAWASRPEGEVALSGTAAVIAGVGELVHGGRRLTVGTGAVGPTTARLRRTLAELHRGERPDDHGWLTPVPR